MESASRRAAATARLPVSGRPPRASSPASPIRGHEDKVRAVSFGGDGRFLLTASDDGLAKVWNITAAEPKLERVLQPAKAGCLEAQPGDGGRDVASRAGAGDPRPRGWTGRALGARRDQAGLDHATGGRSSRGGVLAGRQAAGGRRRRPPDRPSRRGRAESADIGSAPAPTISR